MSAHPDFRSISACAPTIGTIESGHKHTAIDTEFKRFPMKRNLFSLMAILLAMGAMATTANASPSQVGFGDLRADLNGEIGRAHV